MSQSLTFFLEDISHKYKIELQNDTNKVTKRWILSNLVVSLQWDRIEFENEMIPNTESLSRHWKRVCWVIDMWRQADQQHIKPKPITEYGWHVQNNSLTIDWGCESNMKEVRERVDVLLKRCSCKTGCETRQCGCKKKNKKCGEGCNCLNCKNAEYTIQSHDDTSSETL